MSDFYVKKYWEEEDILFYFHFHNKIAVRQLEVSPQGMIHLSIEFPVCGEYLLCDKELDDLDINEADYISEEEFNNAWFTIIK